MRPLEILLVILVVLSVFLALTGKIAPRILMWLCALTVAVLVLHGFIEGPHWQMLPAYVAALASPFLLLISRPALCRLMGTGMLLLIGVACAASAILPMFHLPEPTGPYAIGTRILSVVNEHPSDPSSADSQGKRELVIQVWYPAESSHNTRAPYRKLAETTLKSSYQAMLWTHSRWNAPFALRGNPFPLLLLNPAWSGRRSYYTYLVEDLASHGYIAVSIDHTGNNGPTEFPDGHVDQPTADSRLDFVTHTWEELNIYGAQQLEIQVEDNRFVLDQFENWDRVRTSFFYGHVDMNRVGALGHSFGGAVAAQACLEDSRVKSVLDMDGSFWGEVQKQGLERPIMMIEEDQARFTPERLEKDHAALMDHLLDLGDMAMMHKSNGYLITLHGSTHSSFSDRSLFSPLKSQSGVGSIPPGREYSILRSYVLAFFEKTLNGVPSPLLNEGSQNFPEATLETTHR
jgi:dienelactone hydrolase